MATCRAELGRGWPLFSSHFISLTREICLLCCVQVVSQVADATGEVVLLPDLNGVQGVAFERPTVVLAQVRAPCGNLHMW